MKPVAHEEGNLRGGGKGEQAGDRGKEEGRGKKGRGEEEGKEKEKKKEKRRKGAKMAIALEFLVSYWLQQETTLYSNKKLQNTDCILLIVP